MAPLSHSPATLTHLQIVKAVLYSLAPGTLLVQWVSVEDQLENRHVFDGSNSDPTLRIDGVTRARRAGLLNS